MSLFVDVEKRMGAFHLAVRFETGNGVLSLLGASGCGKSMTLKCIAGIERPDRGRIVLNGRTLYDSEQHIDLPPQARRVGYLLLRVLGPKRVIGAWVLAAFGVKLTMTWWSAIFATAVVIFPLMYRTARGAFEAFDETLAWSGKTLGLSNTFIFWRVRMPCCREGILAGTVLAFARALGEYGATSMIAGYTPGRTATISTTVYQLWRTDNDALAFRWVLVNVAISAVVLLAVNFLEKRRKPRKGAA